MNEEYIPNYLNAFTSVLQSFTSSEPKIELVVSRENSSNHGVSVIIGFVGQLKGQINLVMEKDAAMALTSILAGGMEITEIDEMVKSAMGEFGNMVMGNACTNFSKDNISMDITPPSIITGADFQISNLSPTFYHDIMIDGIGKICFDVAFKSK